MSVSMAGKVALVTGAARGQGRSHAVRLAEAGADIIAIDSSATVASNARKQDTATGLAETASLVEWLDRRIVTQVVDVRERGLLSAAVEASVAQLGRLDAVVVGGDTALMGPAVHPRDYLDALSLRLAGLINTVEVAFPHLSPGASIVCIGSSAAFLPDGGDFTIAGAADIASVHAHRAVARFVHETAQVLAAHGVRVNAVHPGTVDPSMRQQDNWYEALPLNKLQPVREEAERIFGVHHRALSTTIPFRDISEAVLYLASDVSKYVTGMQLKVDAGQTLAATTAGIPD